jgi:heptosyltransferase-1
MGVGLVVRVVLVRLSALGDIVHTWPLASAMHAADPHLHLTWVVEEAFRSLVDGHPAVDSVLTTRTRGWRRTPLSTTTRYEIGALKSRLHELGPELAVDAQGLLKSALVTRWTGAPRRVGLSRPWRRERLAGLAYTETVPGAPSGSHVAATNLELVRALGAPPPPLSPPDGSWLLERVAARRPTGVWPDSSYAVLLPGSGGAHKLLGPSLLAAAGREIAGSGLDVVVAWGPGERDRAADIAASGGLHLAPPTDLEELASLLGGAALVIGGDTGPVHLAASFGVPTVAVFLASDRRRNGPLGDRTAVVSGSIDRASRPSGSARTRPERDINVAEIVAASKQVLGSP